VQLGSRGPALSEHGIAEPVVLPASARRDVPLLSSLDEVDPEDPVDPVDAPVDPELWLPSVSLDDPPPMDEQPLAAASISAAANAKVYRVFMICFPYV
jgi:hypothetical protein